MAQSALWLVPHATAARTLRQRLLTEAGALLAPNVFTFQQFAERVIASSSQPMQRLTAATRRQVLRQIVTALASARELRHFYPIVETDGFLEGVERFIVEFKRLEIWPEQFREACQSGSETLKDRDLQAIYVRYQEILNEHHLFDDEGIAWTARTLMCNESHGGFRGYQQIYVDGFTDFTRTQYEMLEALARRAETLAITLPLEGGARRELLYGKTRQTLDELCGRFPQANSLGPDGELFPSPSAPFTAALGSVAKDIFATEPRRDGAEVAARIEIIAASSDRSEYVEIARRIKQLLIQGDSAEGDPVEGNPVNGDPAQPTAVSPADIVLVVRGANVVLPIISEVFREYGIPFVHDQPLALADSPSLATLESIFQLAQRGILFDDLVALLRNGYFRPRWTDSAAQAPACERVVREFQIPQGAKPLLAQLDYWAGHESTSKHPRRRQEEARLQQESAAARDTLEPLLAMLDQWPDKTSLEQWATLALDAAEQLGVIDAIADDPRGADAVEREQDAWRRFRLALTRASVLEKQLNDELPQLSLDEFIVHLKDILQKEPLSRLRPEGPAVRLLTATAARTLQVPYVFFAGLSETSFPQNNPCSPWHKPSELAAFKKAGLPVPVRDDEAPAEMLLFYEVATRATRRLYLSFPAMDDAAQPLLPSPYLREIATLAGQTDSLHADGDDLNPVPKGRDYASKREFRRGALQAALESDATMLGHLAQSNHYAALRSNLMAGLTALEQRNRQAFGEFDGILNSEDAKQTLAGIYPPQTCWSPSQLEQYAKCPHQFYLDRVLGLEPLAELTLERDWGQRGRLFHDALAVFYSRLAADGATPDNAELQTRFLSAVEEVFAEQRAGSQLLAALCEVDRREITSWADRLLVQHRKYEKHKEWEKFDERPRPIHFELGFGLATEEAHADPDSDSVPFAVERDGETVFFAGRIDRIDIGRVEGEVVFNVIDYKTGGSTSPTPENVAAGLALQLPLYAMAAQQLLLKEGGAQPWQAGYWSLNTKTGYQPNKAIPFSEVSGEGVETRDSWKTLQESLLTTIVGQIRDIRGAKFPVFSQDDKCTSQCSYSTVCRINEVRTHNKLWQISLDSDQDDKEPTT